MDTSKTITHISLCSGYAGIDLGLSRIISNFRTIAYSEIEAFACANLVAKMEQGLLDVAPIWTDLKTFPFSEFRGSVDILSGGFPCQPFSAAGRRAGDDDPRHLWPYIVRGIEQLGRPPIVFFENVEGILSSQLSRDTWSDEPGTPVLLHVLRELERLGYQATAGLFSAREIGAPHQRKRLFILAKNLSPKNSRSFDYFLQEPKCFFTYPAPKNFSQYYFEPSRTIASKSRNPIKFRQDQLRLIGNGVVPDTASRAFYTLWKELLS